MKRLAPYTALALFVTGCATTTSSDPVNESALEFEQTQTTMTGTYARAGSLVEFTSRTVGEQTIVHLEVNGLAFDVTMDQTKKSLRHDGHQGTVFAEDRIVMSAMADALRDRLSLTADMPMHEQILLRTVSYLAEAPAGFTLSVRDLAAPNVATSISDGNKLPSAGARIYEHIADGSEALLGIADGNGNVIDPGQIDNVEVNQACTQSNEDGILYLTSSTSVPKTTTWSRWAEHDCTSHCFRGDAVSAGPGTTSCKGECGPGCYGSGVYSYDCLDHDQCCRHNGDCSSTGDGICSDEFWEADDDFWWGRILWLY